MLAPLPPDSDSLYKQNLVRILSDAAAAAKRKITKLKREGPGVSLLEARVSEGTINGNFTQIFWDRMQANCGKFRVRLLFIWLGNIGKFEMHEC